MTAPLVTVRQELAQRRQTREAATLTRMGTYRVGSVNRQLSQIIETLMVAGMGYEVTDDYLNIFATAASPEEAIERVAFLLQLSDDERAQLRAEPK
jgi:hypothetical protein